MPSRSEAKALRAGLSFAKGCIKRDRRSERRLPALSRQGHIRSTKPTQVGAFAAEYFFPAKDRPDNKFLDRFQHKWLSRELQRSGFVIRRNPVALTPSVRAVTFQVFTNVVPTVRTPFPIAPLSLRVAKDLRPKRDDFFGLLAVKPIWEGLWFLGALEVVQMSLASKAVISSGYFPTRNDTSGVVFDRIGLA